MKRILFAAVCVIVSLMLVGCRKTDGFDLPELNKNFESYVKIEDAGRKYECKIIRTPEAITTLTFCKPQSLKGLTFSWEGGKYTISSNELAAEFGVEPFTTGSAVALFVKILDSLAPENLKFISQEGERKKLGGKTENINYEITLDSEWNILNINIPQIEFAAEFERQ